MGRLEGKRVAFVVATYFEDIELFYPMIRLAEEGAEVLLSALPKGPSHPYPLAQGAPIYGRFGMPVPPVEFMTDGVLYKFVNFRTLSADVLDGLVIPGGFSPDFLRIDDAMLGLVREMNAKGKLLAAICHGPQVLISAGIVKGKRMTCYKAVVDDLKNAGAIFVDEPVVVDGNIVTSRTPDDLPHFCRAIIECLERH